MGKTLFLRWSNYTGDGRVVAGVGGFKLTSRRIMVLQACYGETCGRVHIAFLIHFMYHHT